MERYSDARGAGWGPGARERNLLLEAPASRELEFDCCVALSTPVPPADLNLWCLGITLPPDERLRIWADRRNHAPEEFRIVSGQPLPRELTEERALELGFDPIPEFVGHDDPTNLTRLGVELIEALEAWADNGNQTAVCFHSITSLLQHVSTERTYQFLHPFTNAIREFDARAHYHINPAAHDDLDVERLSMLFDGVRDPGEA